MHYRKQKIINSIKLFIESYDQFCKINEVMLTSIKQSLLENGEKSKYAKDFKLSSKVTRELDPIACKLHGIPMQTKKLKTPSQIKKDKLLNDSKILELCNPQEYSVKIIAAD